MAETIIDKDYLFKIVVRKLGDEIHIDSSQMCQSLNILTTVFSEIDFVATKNELSTELCKNDIIIKNFQGCKKMSGVKDNSIGQYVRTINSFIAFCKKDLITVTTDDIRRYLLNYEKSVCKTTADNCRRNLNLFFQFMEDEEYIKKNPVKKIPKIREGIKYKRFYTDMEIESMRDACVNKKELALVDLLISTGIRVSEVSNIMLNDIDWEQRTIIIHGKGDKDRIVPISIRCKKHLKEYIVDRGYNLSTYLFCGSRKPHNKIYTCSINNLLKKIGSRVDLPDITVHCFRRWFASNLNNKGANASDIQEILGHSSFSTTKKHYLDKSISRICQIHNLYAS